jgi:transglutaminase/protease-like cytokinesis protein 3
MSPEMSSDLAAYSQMLDQLQQAAQQTASDLGRMKIDKWKVDSATKQQSQANTTSLQRNLTAAMPEIIQKAQAAPQDIRPSFTLYRTLNVVYDVLATTTENAGAFGPKEQYEPLARDVAALDQLRRQMADRLDWLAGVKDAQIVQMHQQLAAAQQQAKAAAQTPATTSPAKKTTTPKKKKPAQPPPTTN